MPKHLFPIWILFAFAFFSCERNARISPPKSEKKLVMVCFLSPDLDSTFVQLNWSKPTFSPVLTQDEPVSNAIVQIQGPEGTFTLPYRPDLEGYYIPASEFRPGPGKTYTLKVSEPGGQSAQASTTVPIRSDTEFSVVLKDSVYTDGPNGPGYVYRFGIRFQDPGTHPAWYRIGAYFQGQKDQFGDLEIPMDYELNDRFYLPSQKSLQTFEINVVQPSYQFDPNQESQFRFHLLSVNEDYYRYHQSLLNFEGENPFAEPQVLFKNVENGLGIFAGFLFEERILIKP